MELPKSEGIRKYSIDSSLTDSIAATRAMGKLTKTHNPDLKNSHSPSTSSSHNILPNGIGHTSNHRNSCGNDDNDTDDEKAANLSELSDIFKLNWSHSPEMQKSINWVSFNSILIQYIFFLI